MTDPFDSRSRALAMLVQGASVRQVSETMNVSPTTVRRWRRAAGESGGPVAGPPPATRRQMQRTLRDWGWEVAKKLFELSQEGDVRAAGLLVKLVGDALNSTEDGDDTEREDALVAIERELRALPPAIASEIVGLLAKAGAGAAGGAAAPGAAAGGAELGPVHLPWQEDDPSPDEV